MCAPLAPAIVAGVVSVVGTAATVIGQINTAKAQTAAINQQLEQVQDENRLAASAEMFDRMRAARREQARIRVAAGEAGLGLNSGSVGQLLIDSAMQSDLANQRSIANRESRDAAAVAEATSQMSYVQKPTALGAGLQIASAASSAWVDVSKAKVAAKQK
ncbi:hypothetical protein [Sphingobium sp. B2D3A]|nr:hypothetical protein [Sphingobium sp. B2D3A]